ncbi:hypothetical protein N752_06875 [Desulforamulus aquiferis]|nr:hypothetical protein [Desulforamulus aquiferis]RYD05963.1 hypothetical protein N752_06875 [Desulforamulus aquiferis]
MSILEECKAAGLAQTADNVQKSVGYICNCCSCCCGMFQAIKTFNLPRLLSAPTGLWKSIRLSVKGADYVLRLVQWVQ